MLGAGRIVGTGREKEALDSLMKLGADAVIDLRQPDEKVIEAFTEEGAAAYDVILDFLWGHPTELLLKAFIPKEAGFASRRVRLIHVGEAAGSTISLSGEALRTSGVEITGGAANIPSDAIPEAMRQVWTWIREEKLHIDIEKVPLRDIEKTWHRATHGKRIVIIP